ncbi:MAG: hypothetical protein C6P36_15780 [Geobacillus sp.]|nr:MAG: hypothetical protein C6P36_15780 [Geobacillus sp.]
MQAIKSANHVKGAIINTISAHSFRDISRRSAIVTRCKTPLMLTIGKSQMPNLGMFFDSSKYAA